MNYTITEAQRLEAMDALYLPSMKTEAMLKQKDKAYVMLQSLAPVEDVNSTNTPVACLLLEHLPEGTTHISIGDGYNGSGASHELCVYAFKYVDNELRCYGTDNDGEYGAWSLASLVFKKVPAITPLYTHPLRELSDDEIYVLRSKETWRTIGIEMTKEQCLEILKLLSALEGWSFAAKHDLPDYLGQQLTDSIDVLRQEILK